MPKGLRQLTTVFLYFDPKTGLVQSDNHWATGAYAAPKVTATAPPVFEYYIDEANNKAELNLSELDSSELEDLKMFALVLKRNGYAADGDGWAPMPAIPRTAEKSIMTIRMQ